MLHLAGSILLAIGLFYAFALLVGLAISGFSYSVAAGMTTIIIFGSLFFFLMVVVFGG